MEKLTEGFSVNFVRRQALPAGVRQAAVYAAIGFLGFQVLLAVWLIGGSMSAFAQSQYLQGRIKRHGAAPSSSLKKEMEALHQRAAMNLTRLNTAVTLQQEQFPVADRLAALTKTLPPRTWITGLSSNRGKRGLTVQARALIDPAKPNEVPANAWREALKADPEFSRGLKRISVGASTRGKQGQAEYADFELNAEWQS